MDAPIHVVATTIDGTREALATAATLAQAMDGGIQVIAARRPPSRWSLDRQADSVQALAKAIRRLAQGSRAQVVVLPCVCRCLMDVTQLLPGGSLVLIGGPSRRWWPSREQRLAHELEGLGYRVMFIQIPERSTLRR